MVTLTGEKPVSCGVIVTDGRVMLLGHATMSPRWDIPKGMADPGEDHRAAACRELLEETGLVAEPTALTPIGSYPYSRDKGLVLFGWVPAEMPDPKTLICVSHFTTRDGRTLPEFDRFGLFPRDEAVQRVGRAMAEILSGISLGALCGASK
jgi:8-oxo-dGTP pyrophosphatase MutT (NUDIX family)